VRGPGGRVGLRQEHHRFFHHAPPPGNGHVVGGSITLLGRDLATLEEKEMRNVRGDEVALIPQDPMTSLNRR